MSRFDQDIKESNLCPLNCFEPQSSATPPWFLQSSFNAILVDNHLIDAIFTTARWPPRSYVSSSSTSTSVGSKSVTDQNAHYRFSPYATGLLSLLVMQWPINPCIISSLFCRLLQANLDYSRLCVIRQSFTLLDCLLLVHTCSPMALFTDWYYTFLHTDWQYIHADHAIPVDITSLTFSYLYAYLCLLTDEHPYQ